MTRKTAVIAAAFACFLHAGTALAQSAIPPEVARLFVGAWRAVPGGLYTANADGSRGYPYGQDAVTRIILTSDGYGATSLQFRDRERCATGTGPRQCSGPEAEAAFKNSSSSQYRYRLVPDADDPFKGTMIWDVDLTTYPNWQGQSLSRRYEMSRDGKGLTLIATLPANPRLGLWMQLEREQR